MAPKRTFRAVQSPVPFGNCEVAIEANKFTCKSDPKTLQISLPETAEIKISVREDLNSSNEVKGEEHIFVLVNPKGAGGSCSKSCLQDALQIYSRELPTMKYAANTGKQSMFLEKCVLNGKYCTLLLKSKPTEDDGVVVAATTYQIIPADTQYAEIPLAAVCSVYQHKGLGRLLYMELRKRLQSVGIHTIFCWGDKESEGFWQKQGFAAIAETDSKGRARRLPIKVDIRKALSFPGGSTLMVSHLCKDISGDIKESLKFYFPLKACETSLFTVHRSAESQRLTKDGCSRERDNLVVISQLDRVQSSGDLITFENTHSSNMLAAATQIGAIGANTGAMHCSCSTEGNKRRCETSLSSLKSKKVKGSGCTECQLHSNLMPLASEHGESAGLSGCNPSVEATPSNYVTADCMTNDAKEDGPVCMSSAATVRREHQANGESFKIMLMNIVDDRKKLHLGKVIENLGGALTSDGSSSTHVVTGKVRKTLNFCFALSSGAWIVSPSWLKESFREGRFVDESPHVLSDHDYMFKYRKDSKDAFLRAKAVPGGLLKGYNIITAAHVQPPGKILSAIIKSAGGNITQELEMLPAPLDNMHV